MPFCKDCKNYNDIGNLCARGKRKVGNDPVTGRAEYAYKVLDDAHSERESIWPWRCGRGGRYFEAANAELTGAPLGAPGARRPVARPVE